MDPLAQKEELFIRLGFFVGKMGRYPLTPKSGAE
jgi:hypothetical protein